MLQAEGFSLYQLYLQADSRPRNLIELLSRRQPSGITIGRTRLAVRAACSNFALERDHGLTEGMMRHVTMRRGLCGAGQRDWQLPNATANAVLPVTSGPVPQGSDRRCLGD